MNGSESELDMFCDVFINRPASSTLEQVIGGIPRVHRGINSPGPPRSCVVMKSGVLSALALLTSSIVAPYVAAADPSGTVEGGGQDQMQKLPIEIGQFLMEFFFDRSISCDVAKFPVDTKELSGGTGSRA